MERAPTLPSKNCCFLIVFVMLQLLPQTEFRELRVVPDTKVKDVVTKGAASNDNYKRREPTEVQACEDVATEEKCHSMNDCKWCSSELLDDGCFRVLEARRLPNQVFNCGNILQESKFRL